VAVDGDLPRAAVALAFHGRGAELLFTWRAERTTIRGGPGGAPGGRWSPADASLQATAFRETLETGLDRGVRHGVAR
jgi:8-oxo-dGTP pyrophosphatase MutT (NUDIX family)